MEDARNGHLPTSGRPRLSSACLAGTAFLFGTDPGSGWPKERCGEKSGLQRVTLIGRAVASVSFGASEIHLVPCAQPSLKYRRGWSRRMESPLRFSIITNRKLKIWRPASLVEMSRTAPSLLKTGDPRSNRELLELSFRVVAVCSGRSFAKATRQ
jgi:hypothetical protein